MAWVDGNQRVDKVCLAYERAPISGRHSQRCLRLRMRGQATTNLKASLVREPSLAGAEARPPPTEAWASLEDSMVVGGTASRGRMAVLAQTTAHEGIRRPGALEALS